MGKQSAVLIHTDNDHAVTPSSAPGFLYHLKLGLLLALGERGLLSELQLRLAQERLGGAE